MNRNRLNLFVDAVTAIGVLGLVTTGLLIYFVLPPAVGQGRAVVVGMNRHDWGEVHFWIAMGVLLLLLVHMVLHWQWVCTMCCRAFTRRTTQKRTRAFAGVVALLVVVTLIVGLLACADAIKIEQPGGGASGQHRGGGRD